jgi:hypothetical protein
MKTFPCTFCGTENSSRAGRKRHNQTCVENKSRSLNQKRTTESRKMKSARPRKIDVDTFDCIAGDLSDGAYFAMAEEMGLSIEDFIE